MLTKNSRYEAFNAHKKLKIISPFINSVRFSDSCVC